MILRVLLLLLRRLLCGLLILLMKLLQRSGVVSQDAVQRPGRLRTRMSVRMRAADAGAALLLARRNDGRGRASGRRWEAGGRCVMMNVADE